MSNIFINREDTFNITLIYKVNGSKLEFLSDLPKAPDVAIPQAGAVDQTTVPQENTPEPPIETLTMTFRRPDFGVVQNIMRQSTVMQDGLPILNPLTMQASVLLNLAVGWDVKNEKGKPAPLTTDAVLSLRPDIARAMIDRLYEALGPNAIII